MMGQQNINPEKVFNTIFDTLGEIKSGLKSGELSISDILESKDDFGKVELKAYQVKIGIELRLLLKSQPDLPPMDVLVKILSTLPVKTPAALLPILSEYVAEEWETMKEKILT